MLNQSFCKGIDLIESQLLTQRNPVHKAEAIEVGLQIRHNETELDVLHYQTLNETATKGYNHQHVN